MQKRINRFLRKALRKLGVFRYINITVPIKIGRQRFRIPILREIGIGNLSATEPWMMELISELLKEKNGVFIDVGANIGQTLLKVRSVAPSNDYIGIEPNPACVFYLRELIRANRFEQTTILPIGLFSSTTLVELLFMGSGQENSGASIIENYRSKNKIYDRQYVPVYDAEQVIQTLKPETVAIVKIDVEGAEMEVLKSLQETISRYRPFLLVEILPAYYPENTIRLERQSEIERLVKKLKYEILRVEKTPDEKLVGLKKLEHIGIHGDLKQCDYLFRPISDEV